MVYPHLGGANCLEFAAMASCKLLYPVCRGTVLNLSLLPPLFDGASEKCLEKLESYAMCFVADNGNGYGVTTKGCDYYLVIIGAGVGGHGAALHAVEKVVPLLLLIITILASLCLRAYLPATSPQKFVLYAMYLFAAVLIRGELMLRATKQLKNVIGTSCFYNDRATLLATGELAQITVAYPFLGKTNRFRSLVSKGPPSEYAYLRNCFCFIQNVSVVTGENEVQMRCATISSLKYLTDLPKLPDETTPALKAIPMVKLDPAVFGSCSSMGNHWYIHLEIGRHVGKVRTYVQNQGPATTE
ncbi:hypothetical protein Tco_0999005 [Tanacetum coccineum]